MCLIHRLYSTSCYRQGKTTWNVMCIQVTLKRSHGREYICPIPVQNGSNYNTTWLKIPIFASYLIPTPVEPGQGTVRVCLKHNSNYYKQINGYVWSRPYHVVLFCYPINSKWLPTCIYLVIIVALCWGLTIVFAITYRILRDWDFE